MISFGEGVIDIRNRKLVFKLKGKFYNFIISTVVIRVESEDSNKISR